MIVPDVNILIYAFRAEQPDHKRYRAWLTEALAADEPVALLGQILSGFMRVVTNPRVFARATPPAEAARFAEALRERARGHQALPPHVRRTAARQGRRPPH